MEQILATNPELVGFSATTCGFMEAADLAAAIKARRPEITIVVGNVHATSIGAPLLCHFPEIDALGIGEGEGVMLDLAEGRAWRDIPNLVFREGESVRTNPRRPRINDLDTLPFPAYDALAGFPQGYHLPLFAYEKRWGASMVTSRGCPYSCSFCDRTVFEHLHRFNSAAYIYEHLQYLRDHYGVQHVNIYDDLFTANWPRIHELCERLIARPLGVQFNCAIRAGHTSPEMLALLKRAGAFMVSLGIESADPDMMARHKAGVTLDAVRDTVAKIHAAGLRAKGLFIFGLPGETPATVRLTSDFILSLDLDDMNMTKFSPLHGAPIWDDCSSGVAGDFEEDWRLMNCLNFVFRPRAFADREQMDALYNWHVRRFYDSAGYRRRFARRVWSHRWSLWHLAKHMPDLLRGARYFSRGRAGRTRPELTLPRHSRQPIGLRPTVGRPSGKNDSPALQSGPTLR